jgi:probable F420-dependent oxidoreductase
VKFGISTFITDYGIPVTELARAAEAAGLESLWVSEHTHIPISRATPWPATSTEAARTATAHSLDPFVTLAAAAAVTTTLKVGTAICLVPERDSIVTAKAVASLDHFSGGRFLFGVGAGWNREELANHGTQFASRFRLLRERIEAMTEIWTKDEAEYHGKFVDFGPLWSWPKPVQKPHPPVLLGGIGPRILDCVLTFGDGWLPIYKSDIDFETLVGDLRRLAGDAGRPRPSVSIASAPAGRAEIEKLAAAGVDRLIYRVSGGRDEVFPRLEEIARAVRWFI